MSDPLVEVMAERQIRGWRLGTEAAQSILAALRSRPDLLAALVVEAPTENWTVDNPVWSNWTVDGERQTWKQMYEREKEARDKADRWALLVSDLDRCEHGRHEGDVCGNCNGPSKGWTQAGAGIGHTIDARRIVMPNRGRRHDIEAWFVARQQAEEPKR